MKYNYFQLAIKYIRFLLSSEGIGQIHSPFIYELAKEVIYNKREFYSFTRIEEIRDKLYSDVHEISLQDLGAGFIKATSLLPAGHYTRLAPERIKKVLIGRHAKRISISEKQGKMLFRLINFIKPEISVELGTGFGVSTLYQHLAFSSGKFYTLEGSESISKKAKTIFNKIKRNNITLIPGNFDITLPLLLKDLPKIDYLFIDGNHRKEAVLNYFNLCFEKFHSNTIIVLDDIRWSKEMEDVWEILKNDTRIKVTIDLFRTGIILLKEELSREEYRMRV